MQLRQQLAKDQQVDNCKAKPTRNKQQETATATTTFQVDFAD